MTPTVTCPCGAVVARRSAGHVYCETCSIVRQRDRGLAWSRRQPKVPRTPEQRERTRARAEERKAAIRDAGGAAPSLTWMAESAPDLAWFVRLRVPFSYSLSKNAVWSMAGGGGHVFMRKKATKARASVRDALAAALSGGAIGPVEAKVYIDIFVQKPDHRGDAINVVDSICDGVKEALGVDDRWFSIRRLDWEIQRADPMIVIGVGQAETEHHRACSTCGVIKPLASSFGKNRSNRLGHGRECLVCSRSNDRARRLA